MTVMFSLSNETDETTNFHSYSPAEYSGDSRSGSQSPSNLTEAIPAGSSGTSSSSSRPTKGSRKRQLPPIDLDGGSKSDELNNDSPTTSGSASVSDEESSSGHKSRFISTSNDPRDKRLRLTSFSSTSSTASLLSLGSDSGSQLSLASSDSYHDFAELDGYRSDSVCFGQTPSAKLLPHRSGTTLIADGEFELVGSGQECKAVHIPTQTIYHCMVMNQNDYDTFMAVYERIESSRNRLTAEELRELKRLLMPEETRVVRAENLKSWYVISPEHQGSLHTFYNAESSSSTARNQSPWSEQESKTIFRQVVHLVSYCHQIGIYFGDFRLQKLVYTDRKKNLIRVLHLRNIHVASLQDDTIQKPSTKCCPAYIAPEMMKFDRPYSAMTADIWSLGVLLFVLLTGRFPFYALKPHQLARMIRTGTWSFRPSDKLTRSARLLVYGLIRQNPSERPSAKEVLMCDWLRNEAVYEPAQSICSSLPRPNISIQISIPEGGRLNEANPRIPNQLLGVLMQTVEERNNIYNSRTNIRTSMETFAAAYHWNMSNSVNREADQVVPERPVIPTTNSNRDLLGISVVKVAQRRN